MADVEVAEGPGVRPATGDVAMLEVRDVTKTFGSVISGVVLKYIVRARDKGLGVIFITHNPHHAYPVGDRFLLLKRGRSLGDFAKAEISLAELTRLMSGGAELEQLAHELRRGADDGDTSGSALSRELLGGSKTPG